VRARIISSLGGCQFPAPKQLSTFAENKRPSSTLTIASAMKADPAVVIILTKRNSDKAFFIRHPEL
jgi:hypothetical protein